MNTFQSIRKTSFLIADSYEISVLAICVSPLYSQYTYRRKVWKVCTRCNDKEGENAYQKKKNGSQCITRIQRPHKKISICVLYAIWRYLMIDIDERGKANILVSRTRKRRWEEMENDQRDAIKKKFEHEIKAYKEEITLLKNQMKEFEILKLQNKDHLEKLQALYSAGIIDSNFEPANEMS